MPDVSATQNKDALIALLKEHPNLIHTPVDIDLSGVNANSSEEIAAAVLTAFQDHLAGKRPVSPEFPDVDDDAQQRKNGEPDESIFITKY